jgi:hypothetical protein
MTSVTVVVPMTVRRRGGRKQIIGPDGAPLQVGGDAVEETRGDPVLVKTLARAFRWRRLLEEGRYGSIRELAKAEGVDRNYVGRLLNLTLLAPEVVEAVLEGRLADEVTLRGMLFSKPLETNALDVAQDLQRQLQAEPSRSVSIRSAAQSGDGIPTSAKFAVSEA